MWIDAMRCPDNVNAKSLVGQNTQYIHIWIRLNLMCNAQRIECSYLFGFIHTNTHTFARIVHSIWYVDQLELVYFYLHCVVCGMYKSSCDRDGRQNGAIIRTGSKRAESVEAAKKAEKKKELTHTHNRTIRGEKTTNHNSSTVIQ